MRAPFRRTTPSTYVIVICLFDSHLPPINHITRELHTNHLDYQFWLLGYEFPATLLVLTTEAMYVVTTAKKGDDPRSPFDLSVTSLIKY